MFNNLGSNHSHTSGDTGAIRRQAYEKLTGEAPSVCLSRRSVSVYSQQFDRRISEASAAIASNCTPPSRAGSRVQEFSKHTLPLQTHEYHRYSRSWCDSQSNASNKFDPEYASILSSWTEEEKDRSQALKREDRVSKAIVQTRCSSTRSETKQTPDQNSNSQDEYSQSDDDSDDDDDVNTDKESTAQDDGKHDSHSQPKNAQSSLPVRNDNRSSSCVSHSEANDNDAPHNKTPRISRTTKLSADRFFIPDLSGLGRVSTASPSSSRSSAASSTSTLKPTTHSIAIPDLPELEARSAQVRSISRYSSSKRTSTTTPRISSASIANLPELEAASLRQRESLASRSHSGASILRSSYSPPSVSRRPQIEVTPARHRSISKPITTLRAPSAGTISVRSQKPQPSTLQHTHPAQPPARQYRVEDLSRSPLKHNAGSNTPPSPRNVRIIDRHGSRVERRDNGEICLRRAKPSKKVAPGQENVAIPPWYKWFTT